MLLINRAFATADTWDEPSIDSRTAWLADQLLDIWPAPEGHVGAIKDAPVQDSTWVELKHLLAAELLEAGTELQSRSGQWEGAKAVITPSGRLVVDGKEFESPSSAGQFVKGGQATNGWRFWRLADGRELADVRASYRGAKAQEASGFDWTRLHEILELIPEGAGPHTGTSLTPSVLLRSLSEATSPTVVNAHMPGEC